MRIAIAGGGPGGLYLSILLKRLDPAHEVIVYERNAPDDTFGFGVVFSRRDARRVRGRRPARPTTRSRGASCAGARSTSTTAARSSPRGGHGFSALGRKDLLGILQRRAAALGVDLRFTHRGRRRRSTGDLVVAADGVNSTLRRRHADAFGPSLDRRRAKYVWFGTDLVFDAFTFFIEETEHGVAAGARLSVQRHDEHVHRRDDRAWRGRLGQGGSCEELFGYRR